MENTKKKNKGGRTPKKDRSRIKVPLNTSVRGDQRLWLESTGNMAGTLEKLIDDAMEAEK